MLDLAFNIRGPDENTLYSSSEPNEGDKLNRQSGGEKLKYVLKFYTGLHITWYRACAMTIQHCVYEQNDAWNRISRKPLEIEAWFQQTTNRKWFMANRIVTCPMTSRDGRWPKSFPHICYQFADITEIFKNWDYVSQMRRVCRLLRQAMWVWACLLVNIL